MQTHSFHHQSKLDLQNKKMEFINSLEIQPIISIFALLTVSILLYKILLNHGTENNKSNRKTSSAALPEVPGGLPIIGHLLLFNGDELMHHKLGSMADKYGPAFFFRFGSHKAVVISNWEIAKTCFTTNNQLFLNRPPMLAINLLFFPTDSLSYIPYGDHWRELRKFSSQKLLSNHRVETQRYLRASEVEYCFKQLCNRSKNMVTNGDGGEDGGGYKFALVRMDTWFDDLTLNVLARIIAGKKNFAGGDNAEARKYIETLDEGLRLMTSFTFSDVIPWLGWLDNLRGLVGKMKRCGVELDSIFAGWVDEHRLKRGSGKGGDDDADLEQDFIDLSWESMEQLPDGDPAKVIKLICMEMILNGSGATAVTLTWTLSLLLNKPHVLSRAREELDTHVGNHRQVDESDIPNLVYIQAIIKEGMRLYPPGPFLERSTTEDFEIDGIHIPAGTRLWVNLWKMQRDESVYKDPLEFKPERFLTSNADVDLKGQNHQLLPFGAGRRICPGVSFALPLMHLTLARLIHGFEIKLPLGDEKVDMTENGGIINRKATHLDVLLKPRLPIQQA